MRYRPVDHDPQVNVSRTHPLREFAALAAGLILVLVVCYAALGLVVDVIADNLSVEREQTLFRHAATLYEQFESDADAPLTEQLADQQARVDRLFREIPASVIERLPAYGYQVKVVANDSVNAVALPGGVIVIFSGLLDVIESDQELSFVLGHELGHFAGRDHLRSLGRNLVFALVSALIFGNDSSVGRLATGTQTVLAVRYSQEQEYAADDWSLKVLFAKFGHAEGATGFLTRLNRATGDRPAWRQFLATHPHANDRIERIQQAARTLGVGQGD